MKQSIPISTMKVCRRIGDVVGCDHLLLKKALDEYPTDIIGACLPYKDHRLRVGQLLAARALMSCIAPLHDTHTVVRTCSTRLCANPAHIQVKPINSGRHYAPKPLHPRFLPPIPTDDDEVSELLDLITHHIESPDYDTVKAYTDGLFTDATIREALDRHQQGHHD